MRRLSVFLAGALFLVAGWARAQGTTAALTGTVTSDGKPIAGVTVTASSPSLQGKRTTVTGPNGGYSFPSLPPGDYVVSFELQGLQTVTKRERLILAETTRMDAELSLSKVSEEL